MIRAVCRTLLVLLVLATALPTHAAVFTVTKTADTLDGACDHDCSLREAVAAANASQPGPTVDVVVVPAGVYILTRTGAGEDSNATGDLDVTGELILVGEGASRTFLDGNGRDRVLDVQARVEIFGVTIRHGRVEGSDRVTGNGGGLLFRPPHSTPRSLLHRSVVSHNQVLGTQQGGNGGGIAVFSSFLEVRESAILSNQAAGDGGGIATIEGGFALRNATVTSNSADRTGGGLFYSIESGTTVSSSTVAFNRAGISAGGIASRFFFPGEYGPQVFGSIVALNTAPEVPDTEAASGGYNVFGVREDCEPPDRCGTAAAPLDPRLSLLSSALGPTWVFALLAGSPALGLVPAGLCPSTDQVGQARSAPCEAGAWERVEVLRDAVCVPGGSVLCLQGGRFRVTASLKSTGLLDAQAVPLTVDTGNYWFFSPDNLEVMVKVLNGCDVNQRWWVFTSGLTDRGVILRVEELATGRTWSYETEFGKTYPPNLDTGAFACESAPGGGTGAGDDTNVVAATQAVLVVTRTADTFDGVCDHDCSLREAVAAANGHSGTSVIVAGPGVYTLTRQGRGENQAILGDLDVTDDLVILGAGADLTVLDGGGIDRVLEALDSLELHGVTVRNGRAEEGAADTGDGGGILAAGPLALVRSRIEANEASRDGGGIFAADLTTIRDSTLSGNEAGRSGGGAWTETLLMSNATVSGNQAGLWGGGLLLHQGFIGGFPVRFEHVTVTGNTASFGGGLSMLFDCPITCITPPIEMDWTIVAGNSGGDRPDCAMQMRRGGHNVFGVGEGCVSGPGTLMGTLAQPLDPRLGPLGLHGGTTPTHVPLAGSPVLDRAPCTAGRDQRGRPRPDQTLCDAGAVELLPGVCQPDEDTLCLGADDRFEVTVEWTALGLTGSGKAVPLTLDTGALWFFDPANLELTVKVLDGCGTNGRYWVFLSGLTDVGVEVAVRDTKTDETWTHTHAPGTPFQPRLDTNALEVCP